MAAIDRRRHTATAAATATATEAAAPARRLTQRLLRVLGSVFGGLFSGLFATHGARAVDLPPDRAETMLHVYDGGGVRAVGPALLVRKSLADKVSLTGSYYMDSVSNASIDVVTTASKYSETRNAYEIGADYVVRDTLLTLSANTSKEPDYVADRIGLDVSQEVYGGMTTVSLGYTLGNDKVGKKDLGFFDKARHWQYRLGVTQVLSARWLAAANFEAISDDGYLGSPYRSARVFGAAVPERNPRTRSSRAVKFSTAYDLGGAENRSAVRGSYRYFWDTWAIKAHTIELGYSRYFGERWLVDGNLRVHSQSAALFYSDNAVSETRYLSRNRQLSDFRTIGLGTKVTYSAGRYFQHYDVKLDGTLERVRFNYSNFTDVRTGNAYSFDATVLQLLVSANF